MLRIIEMNTKYFSLLVLSRTLLFHALIGDVSFIDS